MARELGPTYLPFICEVLAAALPARGYTAHVLGHTVHAVVEGMHKVNVALHVHGSKARCGLPNCC